MDSKQGQHFRRTLQKPMAMLALLGCLGLRLGAAQAAEPDAGVASDAGTQAAPAQASGATLSQHFNPPDSPQVGDRLLLTLDVTHPLNTTVHLPEAFPNPRWEVAQRAQKSTPGEASIATSIDLTFQIFRPGATTLPAFDVTVLQADGTLAKLETQPIQVKVLSVLPSDETPELAAPRNPVAIWTDDYTLLWAGGGLLTILLAGGIGFFISRRNRPEPPPPPPRPAHLVALEKLSALTPGELLDGGEYMLFYVRMSEAIREYLGRRYGFRGTELTTTEILTHLSSVETREGWPKGISYADVRDWLNYCDLIKFSDMRPERERSEQLLRQAFSTVELTQRREDASEQASAQKSEQASDQEAEQTTDDAANASAEPKDADLQPKTDAETESDNKSDTEADAQPGEAPETGSEIDTKTKAPEDPR